MPRLPDVSASMRDFGARLLHVRFMKFARRMHDAVPSPSTALAARVRELRASGADIITFGTRPDVPTHVKEAAIACLEAGASAAYTDVRGMVDLRRAIVEKLARENALQVDADSEVVVTAGAKQAVHAAVMALADRGDEVLVENPGWVSFAPIVGLAGAVPVPVPLREERGFVLDAGDLRERITSRSRLVLLCNPHNPTGCVHDERSLRAIAQVAIEHDLAVVADESYERLVYDGRRHVTMATLAGMRERTVTVQTTSKVYNMAGWRVGWLVAAPEIARKILAIQSNSVTCPTSFAQAGAAAALREPIGMGDIRSDLRQGGRRILRVPRLLALRPGLGLAESPPDRGRRHRGGARVRVRQRRRRAPAGAVRVTGRGDRNRAGAPGPIARFAAASGGQQVTGRAVRVGE